MSVELSDETFAEILQMRASHDALRVSTRKLVGITELLISYCKDGTRVVPVEFLIGLANDAVNDADIAISNADNIYSTGGST